MLHHDICIDAPGRIQEGLVNLGHMAVRDGAEHYKAWDTWQWGMGVLGQNITNTVEVIGWLQSCPIHF